MSGHTADSCRHFEGAWRFVAGALHVVFVLLLVAEAGALKVAPQEEPGRTHETIRQDRFESAEASPIGSAVRIIEIRLTPDRASDRKSGGAFDVDPSAPSSAISEVVRHVKPIETDAVSAAFHRPLYHLHRSLLI